jgi:hypothetical protein
VERKNKAPVSDEILRVKIPKPTEMTLPNGLTVLVLEDHRLPLVNRAADHSGRGRVERSRRSARSGQYHRGHVEGRHRNAFEQADRRQTEELGATIGAQAPWGSETATFTASGLSDNAASGSRSHPMSC